MIDQDLKKMEGSTFRAAADSGLWDIFLASIVGMFAIAPLLSSRLGDFWSSAIFLPVWALVYLAIHLVTVRVVRPRVGVVQFSKHRRKRLVALTSIMLAVNVIAVIMGVIAATRTSSAGQPPMFALILPPIVVLIGFSLAALFLQIPRVFFYGLLLAGGPFIGEILFRRGYVSHHGFPMVFGISAVAILACGIARFMSFLPRRQPESEAPLAEGNDE